MMTVGLVILIGWYKPFHSRFVNRMELFNELAALVTLYLMMTFSDFLGEAETRS